MKTNTITTDSPAEVSALGLPTLPCSPFKFVTMAELDEIAKKEEARMDALCDYDAKLGYVSVRDDYGNDYDIELTRIPDIEALMHWIHHLTKKPWMDGDRVHELIKRVYEIKGWNIYRRDL